MQFILSPLFKKMNKDIKLQYSVAAKNIKEGIILLELQLLKYLDKKVTVGLFNKKNIQIDADSSEDMIFVRPAFVVGGGKGIMGIIGAVLIVVGAVLAAFPATNYFGVSMIMYGVGMILAEIFMPRAIVPGPTETDDFKDTPNYSFANFANKIGEQYPIPLVYGLSTTSGILIDYIESTKLLADGNASLIRVAELLKVIYHEYYEDIVPSSGGIDSTYNLHVFLPQPVSEGGG